MTGSAVRSALHHIPIVKHVLAANELAVEDALAPDARALRCSRKSLCTWPANSSTVLPMGNTKGDAMFGSLPGGLVGMPAPKKCEGW
jgi:hypothetical protein